MTEKTKWTHWTARGVISLEIVALAGMPWIALRFGSLELGTFLSRKSAIAALRAGDFDRIMGVSGKEIPESPDDWNALS